MDKHLRAIEEIVRKLQANGVYVIGVDMAWNRDEKDILQPTAALRCKICTDPSM